MNDVLVNAITHKQRLRFMYDHMPRLVEPQCYVIGTRGTELLRPSVAGRPAARARLQRLQDRRYRSPQRDLHPSRPKLEEERLHNENDLRAVVISGERWLQPEVQPHELT